MTIFSIHKSDPLSALRPALRLHVHWARGQWLLSWFPVLAVCALVICPSAIRLFRAYLRCLILCGSSKDHNHNRDHEYGDRYFADLVLIEYRLFVCGHGGQYWLNFPGQYERALFHTHEGSYTLAQYSLWSAPH